MANSENLIPSTKGGYKLTKKDSRKGGIESGKAKRERKKIKKIFEILLDKQMKKGEAVEIEEIETLAGVKKSNMTAKEALALTTLTQALAGNIKATEYILKIIGEHPKEDEEQENFEPVIIVGEGELLE